MTTPVKAIRAKCLDCCCWQLKEVRLCEATGCPIFPYRFGKNPNRAGIGHSKGVCSTKTATQVPVSDDRMVQV